MLEVGAGVRRLPLGELLVEAGVASEADVRDALDEGNRTGEKLGQVVLRRGWLSERKLAKLLADQWGIKAPDPARLKVDPGALARVDAGLAIELGGIPVGFDDGGLVVAVSEPKRDRFEAFQTLLGRVSFVVVPHATLVELVETRSAMFGRTPSPVELVGPWLANGSDSTRVETQGRDIPDEAPLDDDNFDEEPSTTMEQVQDYEEQEVHETYPETGTVVEHLHALAAEVEGLEHEVLETRRQLATQEAEVLEARRQLEAQEAELAELRRAHASDLETISSLGTELEERRRRLDSLRAAVGELTVELEK